MTLQKELNYLINNRNGMKDSLETEFSPDTVEILESLGYIHIGFERDGSLTWKTTSRAKEDYQVFFSKPTILQKIDDFFVCHILRLNAYQ